MTDITAIEAVQRIIADGGDGFGAILALAESAEKDTTVTRWFLGDLAGLVQKEYGKNRLDDFAKKAGIAVSTARKYRNMSAFYQNDIRDCFEHISYTHFEIAKRFKDDAVVFLTEATNNLWTVEESKVQAIKRAGKPAPPRKLLDAECCVDSFDIVDGRLVLMVAPGIDGLSVTDLVGRDMRVKFYESEAA